MTATFLLPLCMGACNALGGDILTDAFGMVAMVALAPLIAIQILGLYYKLKTKVTHPAQPEMVGNDDVIEYSTTLPDTEIPPTSADSLVEDTEFKQTSTEEL